MAAEMCLNDFELLKVIGAGDFGKVVQVRKKDSRKIYSMKVLNKQTSITQPEIQYIKPERDQNMQQLSHPFLAKHFFSFQTTKKLYFINEYINGTDLFFQMKKSSTFTEEKARFYLAEILCALEYLHKQGLLFGNLKPENILVNSDGHVCMTDFGVSKEGLVCKDIRTAAFSGLPEYLAPEVLSGSGCGKPIDWWSFGILMYEMLTGLPPFYSPDCQKMCGLILEAKLVLPKGLSTKAKDLLSKLVADPDTRMCNPEEIRDHPFFAGMDWDKLGAKEITPPYIPCPRESLCGLVLPRAFENESLCGLVLPQEDDNGGGWDRVLDFDGFTYVAPLYE